MLAHEAFESPGYAGAFEEFAGGAELTCSDGGLLVLLAKGLFELGFSGPGDGGFLENVSKGLVLGFAKDRRFDAGTKAQRGGLGEEQAVYFLAAGRAALEPFELGAQLLIDKRGRQHLLLDEELGIGSEGCRLAG